MSRTATPARVIASLSSPNDRRAVWMLLVAAFFWGSGNVANKTMLQDIDPWSAVLLRGTVAAVVLLPLAARELRREGSWRWLRSCVLPSAMFALALGLQQWGYLTATVTNASFLVNAACVLTPVLAFIVLRERLNFAMVAATLVMLGGAFVMSGASRSLRDVTEGDLLCLISAAAYAGWAVALGQQAMRHGRPVATTLVHCVISAAVALPFAASVWAASLPPLLGAAPEVLYLGVFSTALAFLLMIAAQSRVSASVAVVLTAAESLFGAAGAIILLGEVPGGTTLLGALLMLAAIAVVAVAAARPAQATGAAG